MGFYGLKKRIMGLVRVNKILCGQLICFDLHCLLVVKIRYCTVESNIELFQKNVRFVTHKSKEKKSAEKKKYIYRSINIEQISCNLTIYSLHNALQNVQQNELNKTNRYVSLQENFFISCKPHRARAQPRSDLGENLTVTVGIENKKQIKQDFCLRSPISWRNNWRNCNFHNIFPRSRQLQSEWDNKVANASPYTVGEQNFVCVW